MNISRSHDTIRALHVDDDKNQLIFTKEYLKLYDPGIIVESVQESERVIETLKDGWFDCVISDYQMPHLNGIELASRIRKTSNIPIILYTGKGSEEVAEKAFSVGVNDYFRKETSPQHYQVLAKKIREIVKQRRIEEIYTKVVSESRDALIILRGEKIIYGNESFASFVGVDDITEANIMSLFPEGKRQMIRNDIVHLFTGETDYFHQELEIKGKNGKATQIEVTASGIDYLGERALLCNIRDITERKLLENKLKKSEIRYRSLLELAPDGIITINLGGDITWINPAYTEITGFSEEEIIGKKAWNIGTVRGPDISVFFKAFFDLLKGKTVPPMEFQWVKKDGTDRSGEGRASLLRIDGKRTEVLLILRDITARKKLENDLTNYTRNLEELADERANKLLESEKMVAVGAMASSIAHDLRSPLATIRNAVYMMDKVPGKDMSHVILSAVENAVHMLDDVREKTSIEVLNRERVDLAGFIELVMKETYIPSNVRVKTRLCSVVVNIDQLRFRRVLENLIKNAVEAMPDGGVLEVGTRVEGDKVLISVKDNGQGISEETKTSLFQAFKTSKETGTGLGLFYCRKTVEAHGGEIEVRSGIGVGTEVNISLPLEEKRATDSIVNRLIDMVENISFN